jgi:hypothetical protein
MPESVCDRLSPERLRHLTTEAVGHHVYIFNSVDSTNRALARLAMSASSRLVSRRPATSWTPSSGTWGTGSRER